MRTIETSVQRTVLIDAPADVIWQALRTHGLGELQLLMSRDDMPWTEGGVLEWFDREDQESGPRIRGHLTVVSPPRHIVFTAFMPSTGVPDKPEFYTTVDITLLPSDGRTLVTVEHGDFAAHPSAARLAREAGDHWVEMLIRLKNVVEHEAAA